MKILRFYINELVIDFCDLILLDLMNEDQNTIQTKQ